MEGNSHEDLIALKLKRLYTFLDDIYKIPYLPLESKRDVIPVVKIRLVELVQLDPDCRFVLPQLDFFSAFLEKTLIACVAAEDDEQRMRILDALPSMRGYIESLISMHQIVRPEPDRQREKERAGSGSGRSIFDKGRRRIFEDEQ